MNPFEMLKKANQMKKDLKNIQKELEKRTAEATSGGVTVVARGDMKLTALRIDPAKLNAADAAALQKHVLAAANEALEKMKKEAAAAMSSIAGGLGGLSDLLGG